MDRHHRSLTHYRPTTEEFKHWIPLIAERDRLRRWEQLISHYVTQLQYFPDDKQNKKALSKWVKCHAEYMAAMMPYINSIHYPFTGVVYVDGQIAL